MEKIENATEAPVVAEGTAASNGFEDAKQAVEAMPLGAGRDASTTGEELPVVTRAPKAAKRAKLAEEAPLNFTRPLHLKDCLCGSGTFPEYIQKLSTQVEVSWCAIYADRVWGKGEELAALVNTLPEA